MNKIYLPTISNNNCVEVRDKDTIRVWESRPQQNNQYYNYTDYYINSHYLTKNGSQQFNQYSSIPTCVDHANVSDDYFYRNDITDILITFTILMLFVVYIPLKIFMRFFRRIRL